MSLESHALIEGSPADPGTDDYAPASRRPILQQRMHIAPWQLQRRPRRLSVDPKPAPTRMASADMKPIKAAFNRTSLIAHLAGLAAVETKAAKALMVALEATILASVHKKGLGSFTLPGLLKVHVVNVPAKKKRRGIDPFTKVEREFAAKPATVKIKTRALKRLKDAAM